MRITSEALILFFTVAGISLKLADNAEKTTRGYISAATSAVCLGFLISESAAASSIILGIIVGVTFGGKLDQANLIFGLGLTLMTAAVLGFSVPNLPLLAVISVAALIDEVGHDATTLSRHLAKFFRVRMVLKITIILLAILTWIPWIYAIGFFCFDIAYDVTGIIVS